MNNTNYNYLFDTRAYLYLCSLIYGKYTLMR